MDHLEKIIAELQWWIKLKRDMPFVCEKALEWLKRKGTWKDNENGTISCSECGTWFPKEREPFMRFCGYCGASMTKDGEQE